MKPEHPSVNEFVRDHSPLTLSHAQDGDAHEDVDAHHEGHDENLGDRERRPVHEAVGCRSPVPKHEHLEHLEHRVQRVILPGKLYVRGPNVTEEDEEAIGRAKQHDEQDEEERARVEKDLRTDADQRWAPLSRGSAFMINDTATGRTNVRDTY